MKISGQERRMTAFNSKWMSPKISPFRIVEISKSIVTIDEIGISNTDSIDCANLEPATIPIQHIIDNAGNGNKDGLPTKAMQKSVFMTHAQLQDVIYDKLGQSVVQQNAHTKHAMQKDLIYKNE